MRGDGLLRPATRSAPPTSAMPAGNDDASVVWPPSSGSCSRHRHCSRWLSTSSATRQACEWLQDGQLQRPGSRLGGARPNFFTTTRSSSFRVAPRCDDDHYLHNNDTTISATTHPDRSVFSPKDFADLDGHVNVDPCDDIDGPGTDQPTASGRPAGRATS